MHKKKILKKRKVPKRYRYQYTYSEINRMTDPEVERLVREGEPEEKDKAHEIMSKRKMTRLVTYGY